MRNIDFAWLPWQPYILKFLKTFWLETGLFLTLILWPFQKYLCPSSNTYYPLDKKKKKIDFAARLQTNLSPPLIVTICTNWKKNLGKQERTCRIIGVRAGGGGGMGRDCSHWGGGEVKIQRPTPPPPPPPLSSFCWAGGGRKYSGKKPLLPGKSFSPYVYAERLYRGFLHESHIDVPCLKTK